MTINRLYLRTATKVRADADPTWARFSTWYFYDCHATHLRRGLEKWPVVVNTVIHQVYLKLLSPPWQIQFSKKLTCLLNIQYSLRLPHLMTTTKIYHLYIYRTGCIESIHWFYQTKQKWSLSPLPTWILIGFNTGRINQTNAWPVTSESSLAPNQSLKLKHMKTVFIETIDRNDYSTIGIFV